MQRHLTNSKSTATPTRPDWLISNEQPSSGSATPSNEFQEHSNSDSSGLAYLQRAAFLGITLVPMPVRLPPHH
ncbi:hypothetical protein QE152_g29436 [Popillia japonica]|uniref:Uncharacterized protein n=1 Tax=Popillia japonica TaxID=7064 RepID=A0AAW1JHN6_POPJA